MARVVLVTGVSRYPGARVATALQADPAIERVIGVDAVPPALTDDGTPPLGRTEFVRIDLRTPDIAEVISTAGVDTVVHMNLVSAPGDTGGRTAMKETNVIGSMMLLAACQRAATVRRLVVRSTAAVYGSSPRDPAIFTEDMEPRGTSAAGYAKDALEIEGYVRGLVRRRPDIVVSVLRFANFVGPHIDSPLTRYFTLPVVPTVLGFDPRLQFVHEDDGVEAVRRMAVEDHPGTYNVAGHGVLPLSQALRRAGRPSFPVAAPGLRLIGGLARRGGLGGIPADQLPLLRYGRVVDTAKVERELGWRPSYTTVEAFDDFARSRGLTRNLPVEVFDRITEAVQGVVR